MSFTSLPFLILLAAAAAVCFVLPQKWRWMALLAASVIFYAAAGVKLLVFLAVTTLSTFAAGLWIDVLSARRKEAAASCKASGSSTAEVNAAYRKKKQWIAAAALLLNFGILAVLKYAAPLWHFLARIFSSLPETPSLLLPLGISFYTFQSAGYLIDLVREKYPACRNLLKYALFVSFFPQITQGPIGRYDKLAPQFDALPGFQAEHLRDGIQLALWGLFKKLVIADRAAVIAGTIFSVPGSYGGVIVFFGALVYGIQIYCDFSGGIDMARGIAGMFGVELAENFRRPYLAASLAEYWRRWHITLGEWMREYVFYSITFSPRFGRFSKHIRSRWKGRAGKVLPTALVTFVVFFLIGLWHGGSAKYLVFGLYNGVIITVSQLLAGPYAAAKNALHFKENSKGWLVFGILRTLVIVTLGRCFTRAVSLQDALILLRQMLLHPGFRALSPGSFLSLGLGLSDLLIVFCGFFVVLLLGLAEEYYGPIQPALAKKSGMLQVAALLLLLLCITFLGIYREGYTASEFIYQVF